MKFLKTKNLAEICTFCENYDEIFVDFDFTLFDGDSEFVTLNMLMSSNVCWKNGERKVLKRYQKMLLKNKHLRTRYLEELLDRGEVDVLPLTFLMQSDLVAFLQRHPSATVLSLGVQALIEEYLNKMKLDNLVIGRSAFSSVRKKAYASKKAVIISDQKSDFHGDWGGAILYL